MYLSKIQNVFVGFQRSGTNQCSTISCSTETASIPVSHMLLLIFITLQNIVAVLLMTLASIMFELVLSDQQLSGLEHPRGGEWFNILSET